MSGKKFNEMIFAFSAGCLDSNEQREFLEYLKSGQRIPENELGELQNVMALLPAMLELEMPQAGLKDKVAKRLYRMREELRAKKRQMVKDITSEGLQPENESAFSEKLAEIPREMKEAPSLKATGRMTVEIAPDEREFAEKEESKKGVRRALSEVQYSPEDEPVSEGSIGQMAAGSPMYRTMEAFIPDAVKEVTVAEPQSAEAPPNMESEKQRWLKEELELEEEERSHNYLRNILVLSAILIFVLISGGIMYLVMNRELHQGEEKIASLSGQVNALNSEILRLDRNQKVLAILGAKDLRTINLDGTEGNPGGFGKLSLLQNGKEGVIQFYNMPPLKDSEVYQLWLLSKGRNYSLGTFRTKREVEYFPFSVPEISQNKADSYAVTLEDGEGKTSPSKKVYLVIKLSGR
ncbi:MAG: hypothetical protein HF314_10015 [Ignavibacteria bacterium]|nr:hypothetical protein [Ignavibacteria bacterium]MCU7516268.1 hypothetical protein [Ignavibacteria bacterium]